jgi:hypothetical protein
MPRTTKTHQNAPSKVNIEHCLNPEQRRVLNHVWVTSFSVSSQSPMITMSRCTGGPVLAFTLHGVVGLKTWMKAWRVKAFDDFLGFKTGSLANDDQDLYREITSYTWSRMNDKTRDILGRQPDATPSGPGFIGNEKVPGDSGIMVPVSRTDLAMRRISDAISKKALEIVSKEAFFEYFESMEFKQACEDWKTRIARIETYKQQQQQEKAAAVPSHPPPPVVIGVPSTPAPAPALAPAMFNPADLAQAVASAASSVASSAASAASAAAKPGSPPSSNVSVTVAVASVVSAAPAPAPASGPAVPAPLPYVNPVFEIDDDDDDVDSTMREIEHERATYVAPPVSGPSTDSFASNDGDEADMEAEPVEPLSAAPPAAAPEPSDADAVAPDVNDDGALSLKMLDDEFAKTSAWSRTSVTADAVEVTRLTLPSGFRFFSKYRGTVGAKTKGQRDSYCEILLETNGGESRAARLCRDARVPLIKKTDRVLRSKKDLERFWAKLVQAGVVS